MPHHQINWLWNVAPVLSTNLIKTGEISAIINSKLKESAIHLFDNFVNNRSTLVGKRFDEGTIMCASSFKRRRRKRVATALKGLSKPTQEIYSIDPKTGLTTNDFFFEFQRNIGFCEQSMQTPEMIQLQDAITSKVQTYLSSIGNDTADDLASRLYGDVTVKTDMWATVQVGASAYHADHVHDNVFVSGVYYAAVPKESAPLVFRKPEKDFFLNNDNGCTNEKHDVIDRIVIEPEEGEIILFPPWLLHGVPPTGIESNTPRVSFAFNISGGTMTDPWDITKFHKYT